MMIATLYIHVQHAVSVDYRLLCSLEFVVCECDWFKELSTLPGTCVDLVSERQEIEGFKVAVVKDWALNKTRY